MNVAIAPPPRRFLPFIASLVLLLGAHPLGAGGSSPALPELRGGEVNVPWSEIKGLVDRIHELTREMERRDRQEPTSPPPQSYLPEAATWVIKVGRASTTVVAKLDIDFVADDWQTVPVLGTGPSIVKAELDGAPARLVFDGTTYSLLTHGSGRKSLLLELRLAEGTAVGDGSLELKVAPFPLNRLQAEIPATGLLVEIVPAGSIETREAGGKTVVDAVFPRTDALRVFWTSSLPRDEHAPRSRRARLIRHVTIGDQTVQVAATLDVDVFGGRLERLDLRLPGDVTIVDVSGRDVREAPTLRVDGEWAVGVLLTTPATRRVSIALQIERPLGPEALVDVPTIDLLDVEQVFGQIVVMTTTSADFEPIAEEGLQRMALDALPFPVWRAAQHPILMAWEHSGGPTKLTFATRTRAELPTLDSRIDSLRLETTITVDGRRLHDATLAVRNAERRFLHLDLPPGVVLEARVAGRPIRPVDDGQGGALLPLARSTLSGTELEPYAVSLRYLEKSSPLAAIGSLVVRPLGLDLPIATFEWRLTLPGSFAYTGLETGLEAIAPDLARPAPRRNSDDEDVASFAFHDELLLPEDNRPIVTWRYFGPRAILRFRLGLVFLALVVAGLAVPTLARRSENRWLGRPQVLIPVLTLLVLLAVVEVTTLGASLLTLGATLLATVTVVEALLRLRHSASAPPPIPEELHG